MGAHPASERAPRHRVVVVGGGFGGMHVVRGLRRAPVDVTLVDRQNFSPVPAARLPGRGGGALGGRGGARRCAGSSSASATRASCSAEVTGFDLDAPHASASAGSRTAAVGQALPYETLVVAGVSQYSYFGHPEWEAHAPQLKSLEGALDIRSRVLTAFEAAEVETRSGAARAPGSRSSSSAAVPTGVEMAGPDRGARPRHAAARLPLGRHARRARASRRDAPTACCRSSRSRSRQRAAALARALGVTPLVGHTVVDVGASAVAIRAPTATSAGRRADGGLGRRRDGVAARRDARRRGGRSRSTGPAGSPVGPDLTLPGHPEVLALGDMVARARRRRDAPGRSRGSRRWRSSRATTPRS